MPPALLARADEVIEKEGAYLLHCMSPDMALSCHPRRVMPGPMAGVVLLI